MRFTCAGNTHVGVVRSGNEDNFLVDHQKGVFVVADGMGGHAAGEVASEMAVEIIAVEVEGIRALSPDGAAQLMSDSIRRANDKIFKRTVEEHDKRGMGTTVTVLILFARRYLIGQVGDSRAYLFRNGGLAQITKDHSYVQEQVDAGLLTPEQARTHPYSNVITRCVGANEEVAPDIYTGTIESGDVILLASDGLTGMLEDNDLVAILNQEGGPDSWVDSMIADANRRGGLDNVTAVIVRIDEVDAPTGEHPLPSTVAAGR